MDAELDRLRADLESRVHRDTYAAHREGLDHRLVALQQRLADLAVALDRLRADSETDLARAVADLTRTVDDVRDEITEIRTARATAADARQRGRQWMIAGIVVPTLIAIASIVTQVLT